MTILGAAYGPVEVTGKLRNMVCLSGGSRLAVAAQNSVFGDSWFGVPKSLVVVYQYKDHEPEVAVVPEHGTLNISGPASKPSARSSQNYAILGAAYGLHDVTSVAKRRLSDAGNFKETADNSTWEDGWIGVKKTLVVVYCMDSYPIVVIAKEGERMHFKIPPQRNLHIIGAAYGPVSVTDKIRKMVTNESLSVIADNATFGDSWKGVVKSLVVIYRYGNGSPQVATAAEHQLLKITHTKQQHEEPAYSDRLTILGAAYGLHDVTDIVRSLVKDERFLAIANNKTFGDRWFGVPKTLVIAYHYGNDPPKTKVVRENEPISICMCD